MRERKLPPLVINGCDVDEGKTITLYKLIDSTISEKMSVHSGASSEKDEFNLRFEIDELIKIRRIIQGDV
jgi:hypothetical protein